MSFQEITKAKSDYETEKVNREARLRKALENIVKELLEEGASEEDVSLYERTVSMDRRGALSGVIRVVEFEIEVELWISDEDNTLYGYKLEIKNATDDFGELTSGNVFNSSEKDVVKGIVAIVKGRYEYMTRALSGF